MTLDQLTPRDKFKAAYGLFRRTWYRGFAPVAIRKHQVRDGYEAAQWVMHCRLAPFSALAVHQGRPRLPG
jgi:hypothetical protein